MLLALTPGGSESSPAAHIVVCSYGLRRLICKIFQAGDSVVTEMVAVHSFYTTDNVTCKVTGQRYHSVLQQFIILALQEMRCDTTTVFMQDDAPPHIAR